MKAERLHGPKSEKGTIGSWHAGDGRRIREFFRTEFILRYAYNMTVVAYVGNFS